jgi:hypothetical protein
MYEVKVYNTPNLQREAYVTLDGDRISPILPNRGTAQKWLENYLQEKGQEKNKDGR